MSEEQGTKPEEVKQVEVKVEEAKEKRGLPNFFSFKLKGNTRAESMENYSILAIVTGAILLSAGIGLTAVSSKGIPVIMAMAGALISFLAIVVLIILWLVQEWKRG